MYGQTGLLNAVSTFTWTNGNRTIEYEYDANGSLTSKITYKRTGPETTEYVEGLWYDYNLQNRLTKLWDFGPDGAAKTADDVLLADYRYDASGIRTEKIDYEISPARRTACLVDPANHTGYAQVLEETTSQSDGQSGWMPVSRMYYTIGDDVIAQTKSTYAANVWTTGQSQYLLYDGHGSTRQLANQDQSIRQSYNYDAYGTLLQDGSAESKPGATPEQDTSLLYSGEQFDTSSQIYYLRARYYNPLTGLFNRTDPYSGNLHDPQSLHKYAYCHNNPINAIDPSGLSETLVSNLTAMKIASVLMAIVCAPVFYQGSKALVQLTLNIAALAQELISTGCDVFIRAGVVLLSKLSEFTEAAKQLLKDIASKINKTVEELFKMKIFPVPQIILPFIYAHTVSCLMQRPDWFILTYNGKGSFLTDQNRWSLLKDLPSLLRGWSHDEFPYASTLQGGLPNGAMVAEVPLLENCIQGGMLGAFYRWCLKGIAYSEFLVVPIPMYIKGKS